MFAMNLQRVANLRSFSNIDADHLTFQIKRFSVGISYYWNGFNQSLSFELGYVYL